MQIPRVVVHGGAWSIPDDMVQAHKDGMRRALEHVYSRLLNDEIDAQRAVVDAIMILEDDETFDAGRGSFLKKKVK
jgi:beta-aspartyl-peptidase (threonine type)